MKLRHFLGLHSKCRPQDCATSAEECNRLIAQHAMDDYYGLTFSDARDRRRS